jgi:SNF2 family DNA or RNA helicase
MMQLQETKRSLAQTLISSDADVFKALNKDDLLGLLSH